AEIQNRVRQDINTAKLIYNYQLEKISSLLKLSAERSDLRDAIQSNKFHKLENLKMLIRRVPIAQTSGDYQFLDMLSVVDTGGNVLYRAANPGLRGYNMLWDPVVRKCIETKAPQVSTELLSTEKIIRDNPSLLERVAIDIVKTPKSFEQKEKWLSEGMVMRAAYPIIDENSRLLGVLVGGVLLSKDCSIVDKVKETIYGDEKYKGREMGVATIFQGGVRISTNVMTNDNKRAIGTTLSKEVYKQVFQEGRDWVGRAFVVNDWYITAYTPIYNLERKVVGILYTGLLEEKYNDIKWKTIFISLGITTLGMIIAFIISYRMGSRNTIITRTRIRILKEAAEAISSGNLDCKLSPDKISGFDMLDEAFNYMAKSLKDRGERLQKIREQLARSEKLTAVGEMAAGVAHEINNPLGGILLYSNLVLEDIPENSPARENMQKIIYQTNRCKSIVQNLLDFARAPTDDMVPLQINNVIKTSLNLVKDQSMFHDIEIETEFTEDLPDVVGNQSRLEEVFLNLFINAADAMKESGGKLTIITELSDLNSAKIIISDTGKGIDKKHLPHIFEPFFTTKEPGQGTGLGLSIAYGTIREHNGFIDADSTPGKGASFIITLPLDTARYDQSGMIGGAYCN
ncbi:MAG: hypothetical protein COX51_09695, partial [Syntrophobacteraceae bacterium CG23_combo_of_CG06-09_8_20_14_all_50_8]